ncbi:helix-turn-helix domain-containing protein [Bosea sp. NPDC003192]|uniref:helix-turn-helix domain-containing protein n=1 Tax=Bosea sp. NPDC003192 TaxID=3390551 RepID=UPI003CFE2581
MATLNGGAKRHVFRTDDGRDLDGPDRPGSISFLPAGCGRRLSLRDVEWRWAALAIEPQTAAGRAFERVASFAAPSDYFILGMLAEFDRLSALDGGLDQLWCDQMLGALGAYLERRGATPGASEPKVAPLPSRQLQRVAGYVEAQLSAELRISDLARLCDLSDGHFHRAFRAAAGQTPLEYVTRIRVETACRRLTMTRFGIEVIAFKVGFVSPSHFARVFRQRTGLAPAAYRREFGTTTVLAKQAGQSFPVSASFLRDATDF